MATNVRLDEHIIEVIRNNDLSKSKDRPGILMSYDQVTNTATVLMSDNLSDVANTILRNVPCPTQLGIQSVSPDPGRGVWVAFKGDSDRFPFITSFFNHNYSGNDYTRQTTAYTGMPQFSLGM